MSPQQELDARVMFSRKFASLKANYISNLPDLPANVSLDMLHTIYEDYIKELLVDIKCKQ